MENWTDLIVADRMQVDREFNDRVTESEFSGQEWGLIMTATDLDIDHPSDPEQARLVADTENLPQMMPEIDNIGSQMPGGGGRDSGGGGGFLDSLKDAFGLGDGGSGAGDERLAAAERLTQEYAERLQEQLESNGKWDRVREAYTESSARD